MLAIKLASVAAALSVREASAHGKLTVPASRNELGGTSNCAHCLNGGGPCGDSSSLNFFAGPQATWTAGGIVPITVVVTAHHMGHYEFRVCDTVLNSSVADADGCLNRWVLQRAAPEEAAAAFPALGAPCSPGDVRPHCVPFDATHPERWYLPPRGEIGGTHTVYFKVPAELQCDVCTLQWHWWSANSCEPAGDYGCYKQVLQSNGYWAGSKAAWWTAFGGACSGPAGPNGHSGCGEQFWNCADISVRRGAGPFPTPATTPTTTRAPTTPPTTSRRLTIAPTTTEAPSTSGPVACGGCQPEWRSACVWTNSRCYPIAEDVCRSFQGAVWCGQGGEATTTPASTPTQAPTPAPTLVTTARPTAAPSPGGGACPGEPCGSTQLCRSKWGHCGQGASWCNDESTWKAEGCGPSLVSEQAVKNHAFVHE